MISEQQQTVFEFLEIPAKKRAMSCAIKQLDSKQDSVITGRYEGEGEHFDWMVVADGHGSYYMGGKRIPFYNFQDEFNALNHEELVLSENPIDYIHSIITDDKYPANVGATLIIVKIFDTRITTYSIGDSSIRIYLNGELSYKNIGHKISNPSEVVRLNRDNIKYTKVSGYAPAILSETHLSMNFSPIVRFTGNGESIGLSLTQSIGHHQITGFEPECYTLSFSEMDVVQVVAGSDGVFDMVNDIVDGPFLSTATALEIADFAENRWKQDWMQCIRADLYTKYPSSYPTVDDSTPKLMMTDGVEYMLIQNVTTFPDYDDISCAVWSYK